MLIIYLSQRIPSDIIAYRSRFTPYFLIHHRLLSNPSFLTKKTSLAMHQRSVNLVILAIKSKKLFRFGLFNAKFKNSWLLSKYLSSVGSSFLGLKTEWLFLNIKKVSEVKGVELLWRKFYKKHKLVDLYDKKGVVLRWMTQLILLKDPTNFIILIRSFLLKMILKRHKRYFFFINKLLTFFYINLAKLRRIRGYSLFFKGKLGKKGSVRKAKFFAKKGLTSFTNKSLRINYRTYYIWTHTGVIGAGISVFY